MPVSTQIPTALSPVELPLQLPRAHVYHRGASVGAGAGDAAALDAHREAPHYKKWRATVERMFDGDIERVAMRTVFPSDAGWRAQKAGLLEW